MALLRVDDLTGEPLAEGQGSQTLILNNRMWKLDLTPASIKKLDDALKPFTSKAEEQRFNAPSANTTKGSDTKNDPYYLRQVREWANKNGHSVSSHGRIPASVLDAYKAAH